MSVTLFSFLLLPLCLIWMASPDKLLRLTAMVSCFEAAAAFVIGGFGVAPGLMPTLVFMGYMLLQLLLGARYPGTALVWRLTLPFVFVSLWAVTSSILMPRVFEGAVYVWPQRMLTGVAVMAALAPNPSNLNQDIYVVINCAFMILAGCYLTLSRLSLASFLRAYLMSGFIVAAVSVWQLASRVAGVPFPEALFYSNPSWAILTAQSIGPVPRINGPFTEPSSLAGYMASIVCATGWLLLQGRRDRMFQWLFGVGLMTMAISTSTTGFAVLGIVGIGLIVTALISRSAPMMAAIMKIGLPLAVTIGLILFAASVFVPSFNRNVAEVFDATMNKQQSSSYEERTGADLDSLGEVVATYGLGVGWGSNRSSSLIPGLLASLGIPGSVALLWFGVGLTRQIRAVRRAGCSHEHRVVMDGCGGAIFGFLLAAAVSSPQINVTVFYFLLGLLIACSVRAQLDIRGHRAAARNSAHVRALV